MSTLIFVLSVELGFLFLHVDLVVRTCTTPCLQCAILQNRNKRKMGAVDPFHSLQQVPYRGTVPTMLWKHTDKYTYI